MSDGPDNPSGGPPTVHLVGAGPGDHGLLTNRAMSLLMRADVVVYDALVNPLIIDQWCRNAECICVGKRATRHTATQDEINALLVDRARAGKRVVRLKGGDPFIFGRGSEEALHLHAHGVRCEIVPGVPAAVAAAAYAGIPLTHRNLAAAVVFVTGHEAMDKPNPQLDYDALAKLGRDGATICIYMGMARLPEITAALIQRGMAPDTPAAVVRWATLPHQQSHRTTLANLAADAVAHDLKAPAMIYIGPVVALDADAGGALNWFEHRPLFGRTVLVTRTRDQASQQTALLADAGAAVIEAPTIDIAEPEDTSAVDLALEDIRNYDWLLLTSANAVRAMKRCMLANGLDLRDLSGVQIGVVGSSTAQACRDIGLLPDLTPRNFTGDALAEALCAQGSLLGKRILLLRADIAGATLPERLTEEWAKVDDVAIYVNRPAAALPDDALAALRDRRVHWVTFTSSSTARNLVSILGDERNLLDGVKVACIGPKTADTAAELGLSVTVTADPSTLESLVAAIVKTERPGV